MAKGKLAALVIGPPKDGEDDDDGGGEHDVKAIGKDILKAIKDDDPEALGMAIKACVAATQGDGDDDDEDGSY